jgi:hypothetical protein
MDDHEKLKVVIRANSQVAVFGSGVSRIYRRIVRYNFHIGPDLPFSHCERILLFFYSHFLGDII